MIFKIVFSAYYSHLAINIDMKSHISTLRGGVEVEVWVGWGWVAGRVGVWRGLCGRAGDWWGLAGVYVVGWGSGGSGGGLAGSVWLGGGLVGSGGGQVGVCVVEQGL